MHFIAFRPGYGRLGRSHRACDASQVSVFFLFAPWIFILSLIPAYAWDQVPRDSVVCDIGGGNGHASLGLVKAYPHLKIVLQDLPATIEQGREAST